MLCPNCSKPMQEVTKTGVLIDVCADCRGVWLDRGELEKILDRARDVERDWDEERSHFERRPREYGEREYYERRHSGEGPYRKKKRWTEIFDIFD